MMSASGLTHPHRIFFWMISFTFLRKCGTMGQEFFFLVISIHHQEKML